jgi:hypothetical protein
MVSDLGRVRIIPGPGVMTRGRAAYEADVRERPNYHDGKPRPSWNALSDIAQWSWEKSPYPLPCAPITGEDHHE